MTAEKPDNKSLDISSMFSGLLNGLKNLPGFLENAMKNLEKWFQTALSSITGGTQTALDNLKQQIDPEAKADTIEASDSRVANILTQNKDKQKAHDISKRLWEIIQSTDPAILQGVDQFGLWTYMTALIGQESSRYDHKAVSHLGAFGLFQIMPSNFRAWGLVSGNNAGVDEQCKVAIKQVCNYYRQYQNWEAVSVAWNAGPSKVAAYLRDSTSLDKYGKAQQNGTSTGQYARAVRERQRSIIAGTIIVGQVPKA